MTDEDSAIMLRLSALMDEAEVSPDDRLAYLPEALVKLDEES